MEISSDMRLCFVGIRRTEDSIVFPVRAEVQIESNGSISALASALSGGARVFDCFPVDNLRYIRFRAPP